MLICLVCVHTQLLVVMLVGKEDFLAIATNAWCAMTLTCVLTAILLVRLALADTVPVIRCSAYSLKQMLVSMLCELYVSSAVYTCSLWSIFIKLIASQSCSLEVIPKGRSTANHIHALYVVNWVTLIQS